MPRVYLGPRAGLQSRCKMPGTVCHVRGTSENTFKFLFGKGMGKLVDSCDPRTRAYKNGKTFDQCREIARGVSSELARKVDQAGQVQWSEILEAAGHDELVYKLTLKYLRQDGYNIGDWKAPKVTRP